MKLLYRLSQIRNALRAAPRASTPLRWVFLYGLPRSGTTYALDQYMRISRRGIGDWMMEDFALTFDRARQRTRQTLDIDRLADDLRNNLLTNAPIGGGTKFDIVIKQASATYREYAFWRELFGTEPERRLFFYREPAGWLASAKEKFDVHEARASAIYQHSFDCFAEIGGLAIDYPETGDQLASLPEFSGVEMTTFKPRRTNSSAAPDQMSESYREFVEQTANKPWNAQRQLVLDAA